MRHRRRRCRSTGSPCRGSTPPLPRCRSNGYGIVSTGSWASGNFPGVAGCKAGDALAALLPAQYPLMVAVGRFCDLSRPVATDRITDANDQEIGSFVCTYAGMVRPLPKSDQ